MMGVLMKVGAGAQRRPALWRIAGVGVAMVIVAASAALAQSQPAQEVPARAPVRELTVATKEAPPFAMKSPDGAWTGVSIELWNRIGAKLGARTTFREYGTVPEMLEAVSGGAVDVATAAITVTSEREKSVDFSQPFFASGLGVAVPAHKEIEWLKILRGILSLRFFEAVGVLIGAATLVGSLIWLIERRQTEHYDRGPHGLGTGLWWSASAMTQAAAPDKAPATLYGRALGMLWMITSIVIIASFTAGITSQLASKRLAAEVRTSADLAAMRTGSVDATRAFDYLRSEHVDVRGYPNVQAGLEAIKKGKLDALLYDRPILAWNVRKNFMDEIDVLEMVFAPENYAIAVRQGSPLRAQIDLAMLDELGGGWWRDVLQRYFGHS